MRRFYLFLLTFFCGCLCVFGQNALAEGDRLFDAGKYEDAKRQYMLHKMNSNDRIDYTDLRIGQCDECLRLLPVADYLFSEKDYAKAKENYNKVLTINPKDPTATARLRQIPTTPPDGVVISGITWATCNVGSRGTFVSSPQEYGEYYTWTEAQNSCPQGWRLPTKGELKNLVSSGYTWKYIGYEFAGGKLFLPVTRDSQNEHIGKVDFYWSSTPNYEYKDLQGKHYYHDFYVSELNGVDETIWQAMSIDSKCRVRCVHE